jgi:cellulose synthase (UDP-forming)
VSQQLSAVSVDRYPSPWLRLLIVCTALLGVNYIVWRWLASINWSAWWISVPLVIAETYSCSG